jgi:hypothetical protein
MSGPNSLNIPVSRFSGKATRRQPISMSGEPFAEMTKRTKQRPPYFDGRLLDRKARLEKALGL